MVLSKEIRSYAPHINVLIDTPPSLTFEFRAALLAADVVIVPVSYSIWTVRALNILRDEISKVEDLRGRAPKLIAVPCMVTEKEVEKLVDLRMHEFIQGLVMTSSFVSRSGTVRNMTNNGKWFQLPGAGNKSFDQFKDVVNEIKRIVK